MKANILRVVGQNLGGGARIHVHQLNTRLIAEGCRVCTLIPAPLFVDSFTSADRVGMDYRHTIRPFDVLRTARAMQPLTFVHSHLRNATVMCDAVNRLLRIPHVITIHTPIYQDRLSSIRDRVFIKLMARSLKHARLVIFISEYIRTLTLQQLDISANDIKGRVIYNGTTDPGPLPDPVKLLGPLQICIVGELTDRKGMADLAWLAEEIAKVDAATRAHIHVYGEGTWRGRLEEVARRTGTLSIHGYEVSNNRAYSGKHLNLMLGRTEAFGRTITEAKACAVPTLAYDMGAFPELIENSVDGILVGNRETLLLMIIELQANPDLLNALRINARKSFERRFTVEVFTATTLSAIADSFCIT